MADFLDRLAYDARITIEKGYYHIPIINGEDRYQPLSLKKSITNCNHAPIITEIKRISPTLGVIWEGTNIESIVLAMKEGGAVAISVLTEPKHFGGSLRTFTRVRERINLPLLLKDIVLSRLQIDVASAIGADAILLIKALFDRNYCESDAQEMIEYAQSKGIEVLFETHTEEEFLLALDSPADLVGINNRDLKTLKVDVENTRRILEGVNSEEVIVSESGIETPNDIRSLRASGAQAFLVGSSIMRAGNIKRKVRELVMAI